MKFVCKITTIRYTLAQTRSPRSTSIRKQLTPQNAGRLNELCLPKALQYKTGRSYEIDLQKTPQMHEIGMAVNLSCNTICMK